MMLSKEKSCKVDDQEYMLYLQFIIMYAFVV